MSLDKEVIESLKDAVKHSKQSKDLGNKLLAWLQNMSDGNEGTSKDDVIGRIEGLLEEVEVKK